MPVGYSKFNDYGVEHLRVKVTEELNIDSAIIETDGADATGDLWYRDASGFFKRLPIGTAGQKLTVTGGLPVWEDVFGTVSFVIDGGGSAITTGFKGYLEIPFACTITQWTLIGETSGSITIDIWKGTYTTLPTVSNTITASAKPLYTSTTKGQSATLTGWTTSIAAGDILGFNVDSVTSVTRVTLSLKVKRL